jgi:hypothetical protein
MNHQSFPLHEMLWWSVALFLSPFSHCEAAEDLLGYHEHFGFYINSPETLEALVNLAVEFYDKDTSTRGMDEEQYQEYVQNLSIGSETPHFKPQIDIEILMKSRTVSGASNTLYYERFMEKINSGTCVTIVTVGGSVTCGAGIYLRDEKSWPMLLERFLNQMFPCFNATSNWSTPKRYTGEETFDSRNIHVLKRHNLSLLLTDENFDVYRPIGSHTVINRCIPASGSSFVSHNFELVFCDLKDQIDLVMMEFASNDLENNEAFKFTGNEKGNLTESAPKYLEFLIRKLDSLNISQMFIQASFRFSRNITTPHFFNAEAVHLPIQKFYDVPTISFPATFLDVFLKNRFYNASRFYDVRIMRDSYSHLTGFSHDILTFLILWNLQRDMFSGWTTKRLSMRADSHQLQELTNAHWDVLNGQLAEYFDFRNPFNNSESQNKALTFSSGWNHTSEGRRGDKWGLVSQTEGAQVYLSFANASSVYAVSIGFMKSYSEMGAFKITFGSNEGVLQDDDRVELWDLRDGRSNSLRNDVFKTYVVDSLWDSKTSQFYPEAFLVPNGSSNCVIEVLDEQTTNSIFDGGTQRPDRGLKVKLLSMSVYFKSESCQNASERRDSIRFGLPHFHHFPPPPPKKPWIQPEPINQFADVPQEVESNVNPSQVVLICAIVIVLGFLFQLFQKKLRTSRDHKKYRDGDKEV